VGGFDAKGNTGSSVKQGSTTSARIPEGAIVEKEIDTQIGENDKIALHLRTPSFAVSSLLASAINKKFAASASATDGGSVRVTVPTEYKGRVVELIAALEDLDVTPVRRARIVVNERTGTIVAGGDVRLAPSAIVHGALTVIVKEAPTASQPTAPFGAGTTVVTQKTELMTHEDSKPVAYLSQAASLSDVASALSQLGLSARELTSVLQALRAAGALEAELVVQ